MKKLFYSILVTSVLAITLSCTMGDGPTYSSGSQGSGGDGGNGGGGNVNSDPVIISSLPDGITPGDGPSTQHAISPDGTKVVFSSAANNFGAGGQYQIYLVDLNNILQLPLLLSSTADGTTPGNGSSYAPSFSPDGTKVVFRSNSSNFGYGGGANSQIFMVDLNNLNQLPQLLSTLADGTTPSNGYCNYPSFSPDGNKVIFNSTAINFGSPSGKNQIYMVELNNLNQNPQLLSSLADGTTPGDDSSFAPHFRPDGNFVIFSSKAFNFGAGGVYQIYMVDLNNLNQSPLLLSSLADGVTTGNGSSMLGTFNPSGTHVVFRSNASNFGSSLYQSYRVEIANLNQSPELLSTTDGVTPGDGDSYEPIFSNDGNKVSFSSRALNFGSLGQFQIVTKNLLDLSEPPVIISTLADGITQGNSTSSYPRFTLNDSNIIFSSNATNLTNGQANYQILLKEL
ncbi:hypothetical protein N9W41_01505 [bacterium]|nr:hypothetical protein [bacterium]